MFIRKRLVSFLLILVLLCCCTAVALAETTITFSESSITITKGKSANITAAVSDTSLGKPNKTVWETSNKTVAAVSGGKITGKGPGTAVITCTMTWKDGTEATGSIDVKVTQPVTSVKLSEKKVTVAEDSTVQLQAVIVPENADDQHVTWTSSNESIATVDENGLVTGIAAGKCTVTAEAADGSGKKASASVTVT